MHVYSPAFTGTHCAYPWRNGQAELAWVAGDGLPVRQTVTHPSTNRARRRVTSLIDTKALPLKPNRHLQIQEYTEKETNFWRIPLQRARLRGNLGHFERSFWCAWFVQNNDSDASRVRSFVVPQSHGIISLVGPLGRTTNQDNLIFELLKCNSVIFFNFFWSLKSQQNTTAR